MNELKIKLSGAKKLNPTVLIDGKPVKLKKNRFGSYEATYLTEKSEVELSIHRLLELSSPLWWLWGLLFWLISFFGLLDIPYPKNCTMIDCNLQLKLNSNTNFEAKFLTNTSEKALEYTCDSEVIERKNEFYVDKKIKTRRRLTVLFKTLSLFVLIIVALILITNK